MHDEYTSRQAIVAAKLPALAEALSKIDSGAFWEPESIRDRPASILRLVGTELAFQFLIHPPRISSPADLYGCRPHFLDDDGDSLVPTDLRICVSISRPIQLLARDIHRRLILPWQGIMPDCVKRRDARRETRIDYQRTIAAIRRSTNHAEAPCGRDHSTFDFCFGSTHISLVVGQGGSVEMRGRHLSSEQSIAVINALRTVQI